MRELFLKSGIIEDAQGRARSYDYFVLVDEVNADSFSCESYGVKIEEKGSGQSCAVPHITTSAERIDQLCELLLSGCVTPVTLRDVVLDWL